MFVCVAQWVCVVGVSVWVCDSGCRRGVWTRGCVGVWVLKKKNPVFVFFF